MCHFPQEAPPFFFFLFNATFPGNKKLTWAKWFLIQIQTHIPQAPSCPPDAGTIPEMSTADAKTSVLTAHLGASCSMRSAWGHHSLGSRLHWRPHKLWVHSEKHFVSGQACNAWSLLIHIQVTGSDLELSKIKPQNKYSMDVKQLFHSMNLLLWYSITDPHRHRLCLPEVSLVNSSAEENWVVWSVGNYHLSSYIC